MPKEKEICLYPSHVYHNGVRVPYDVYKAERLRLKVGGIVRHYAGAPGVGYVEYRITGIDNAGIHAVEVKNTIWVPDGDYYR